jgi:hypothetical protein
MEDPLKKDHIFLFLVLSSLFTPPISTSSSTSPHLFGLA